MAVWSLQQPLIETYHEALVGCLVPFLELQPHLAEVVFQAIAQAWPKGFNSNTPKVRVLLLAPPILLLCRGPVAIRISSQWSSAASLNSAIYFSPVWFSGRHRELP